MSKLIQTTPEVVGIENLGNGYVVLSTECPEIAKDALPGNFVNIKIDGVSDLLLRRPIGIFDVEGSIVKFLVKPVGKGTEWLGSRSVGDKIDLIGPLGKGLFNDDGVGRVVLVAGGVGLAPLFYYLTYNKKSDKKTVLFYGARTKEEISFKDELAELVDDLFFATEDGSLGEKGFVTDAINKASLNFRKDDLMMVCGPKPMLKSVIDLAESVKVRCQVSLENYMGCGTGVCLSCAIPVLEYDSQGQRYRRVCVDGPVMDSSIIDKKKLFNER